MSIDRGSVITVRSRWSWWAIAVLLLAFGFTLPSGVTADAEEPPFDPDTGSSAYTGPLPAPDDDDEIQSLDIAPAASCTGDEQVAVLQSNVPWFAPADLNPLGANVHELEAADTAYCIISPSQLESFDLSRFVEIVISAAQSQTFYDSLFPGGVVHPALSDWVASGGLLKANLTDCASGPGSAGTWATQQCNATAATSYEFVGGVKHVSNFEDRNSLGSRRHPILTAEVDCPSGYCGPLINVGPQEDLNGWNYASHGYFIDLPEFTTVLIGQPDVAGNLLEEPVAIDYPYGEGRVIASLTTAEWRYGGNFSGFENRKLLANLLAYEGSRVSRGGTPYPLLGAHGITGTDEDMVSVLNFSASMVPLIPLLQSAETGEVTSVWTNGDQITREAAQMLGETGSRHVNLIAHSKGGLDSRVAMWRHWELFSDLGMLGTPNGGSEGADRLCALRRLGVNFIRSNMGPCDSADDGLFNLQTDYMSEVFNKEVRDWATHTHYVVAADCTKFFDISLCNELDGIGMGSLSGGCELGGDKVVCVESAFDRARGYGDGIHYALDPVFDLDHTQVRESPCTNSRVLAPMYGRDNFLNPWIDGDGSGCEDLPYDTDGSGGFAVSGLAADEPDDRLHVDQTVQVVSGSAGQPTVLPLEPEGGDTMRVTLYGPGAAELQVLTDDGRTPQMEIFDADLLGDPVQIVDLAGLEGRPVELGINPAVTGPIGVITRVELTEFSVTARALPDGEVATIEVDLDGASGGTYTVTARAEGTETVLAAGATDNGEQYRYTGALSVSRGDLVPVDIIVEGPQTRFITTGVVLDEGSGEIGDLVEEELVDLTGDGNADEWRLAVEVDVAVVDSYHLNVDLTLGDGTRALSAPGRAALDAGTGRIEVTIPLPALLAAGSEGPFELTRATLSRGDGAPIRVATRDWIGRTGELDLGDITADELTMSEPEVRLLDNSGNGKLDELAFDTDVWSPQAAALRVEASLLGPDGARIATFDQQLSAVAGRNVVRLGFDGTLVRDNGSGVYSLLDIRITAPDELGSVRWPLVATPHLDAGEWGLGDSPAPEVSPEALLVAWDEAWTAGDIAIRGQYVAQRNRLERLIAHAHQGALDRAIAEIDRFVENVERHTPRAIEPERAETLVNLAAEVRASLTA